MSAESGTTSVEYSAVVAILGECGEVFAREIERHLAKPRSKAQRDLSVLADRLKTRMRFGRFDDNQRKAALLMIETALNLPKDNSVGRKAGSGRKLSHEVFAWAVPQTRPTVEASAARFYREHAHAYALGLAQNEEWLKTRPDICAMPVADRVSTLEAALVAQADRLGVDYGNQQIATGQGRKGETAYTVELFNMAAPLLSAEARSLMFDDTSKPEYDDGRDIPLLAAAKSYAIQESKGRKKAKRSAG